MFDGCGHDVLGHAVQPVRQLAAPGRPPRSEPLVTPPAQQQGPGTQRIVERELVQLRAVPDQADPAAYPEALVAGRVLDDSVERDVVADDDLSHLGLYLSVCCCQPPPRRRRSSPGLPVVRIGMPRSPGPSGQSRRLPGPGRRGPRTVVEMIDRAVGIMIAAPAP